MSTSVNNQGGRRGSGGGGRGKGRGGNTRHQCRICHRWHHEDVLCDPLCPTCFARHPPGEACSEEQRQQVPAAPYPPEAALVNLLTDIEQNVDALRQVRNDMRQLRAQMGSLHRQLGNLNRQVGSLQGFADLQTSAGPPSQRSTIQLTDDGFPTIDGFVFSEQWLVAHTVPDVMVNAEEDGRSTAEMARSIIAQGAHFWARLVAEARVTGLDLVNQAQVLQVADARLQAEAAKDPRSESNDEDTR